MLSFRVKRVILGMITALSGIDRKVTMSAEPELLFSGTKLTIAYHRLTARDGNQRDSMSQILVQWRTVTILISVRQHRKVRQHWRLCWRRCSIRQWPYHLVFPCISSTYPSWNLFSCFSLRFHRVILDKFYEELNKLKGVWNTNKKKKVEQFGIKNHWRKALCLNNYMNTFIELKDTDFY